MIFNRPEFWMKNEKTLDEYLTFRSAGLFALNSHNGKTWDGMLEYSTDKTNWEVWDGNGFLYAEERDGKGVLYLRGTRNTVISGWGMTTFAFSGDDIECMGNIETLLDYETVKSGNHPIMGDLCFFNLFAECTSLVTVPSLPATTLTPYCYNSMFQGCTNLVTIPSLPAITLEDGCYASMFSGCTKLKLSTTKTEEYTQAYRIPTTGGGTATSGVADDMFAGTGGTFTGTPDINKTYYLSNTNTVV